MSRGEKKKQLQHIREQGSAYALKPVDKKGPQKGHQCFASVKKKNQTRSKKNADSRRKKIVIIW